MSDSPKAVFLSYASQDADDARRICESLRQAGVEVWFDADGGLEHGDEWDAKIRKQIKECVLFIPLISAHTQARHEGYFRLEWELAAQRAMSIASGVAFILPVVIDDTREPEALVPDRFRMVQWTKLPGGVVTPEVKARYLKLWSNRTGALRHEQMMRPGDAATAAGIESAVGADRDTGRRRRRAVLVAAIASIAVVVAVATLQPWKQTSGGSGASTVVKSGARTSRPEVAGLLIRVRALADKTDVVRTELDTAVGLLEQAAKLDPTDANVWAEWALVDRRYAYECFDRLPARLDSARRHARQALGLDPANAQARFSDVATMVLLDRGEAARKSAVTLLEPLANQITDHAGVLFLLADLKRDAKNPEAVFGYLERAAQIPGWAGRAEMQRMLILFSAGRMAAAEQAIDRALAKERAAVFLLWKGFFLSCWQGDVAAARRVVAEVPAGMLVEDFPASARFFTELWARDYDQAFAALSAVPRDYMESVALPGPTGYYKGYVLARAGRNAAAQIEWRSALEVVNRRLAVQSTDRDLLRFKALLLATLGEKVEGEKLWRSTLDLSGTRELYGHEVMGWPEYHGYLEFLPAEAAIEKLAGFASEAQTFGLAACLRLDPFLDRLRSHPNFIELLARAEADPRLSPKAKAGAVGTDAKSAATKSIAVLPFVNLGADKGDEYLGDGLTEELLNALAKLKGLRVPGRSSCFAFKGKTGEDIFRQVGERLSVRSVLEGTVRRAGNKVRITAQLINVADGFRLWGEEYDKEMTDILAIQTEVAQRVVSALQLQLGGEEAKALAKKPTENPEAHRLYLLGLYHSFKGTTTGWHNANECYRQATEIDPHYALAWAGWAYNHGYGWATLPGREARAKEFEFAKKAVALDPSLAEAQLALGAALADAFQPGAEQAIARAIELNPNLALAYHTHAWLRAVAGFFDDAIATERKAIERDPLSTIYNHDLGWFLYYARRDEEAVAQLEKTLELDPNSAWAHAMLGWFRFWKGDVTSAVAEFERASALDPQPAFFQAIGYAHARAGNRAKVDDTLRKLDELAKSRYVSPSYYAVIFLGLGDKDKVFEHLEKAFQAQDPVLWSIKVDRLFEPLHADPRFQALLKKVGLDK